MPTDPSPRLLAPARLVPLVAGFRDGSRDLRSHVTAALDRIETLEPVLRAMVPEPGRRERVLGEAEALLARHPDPATRPTLFGALAGIKDIIAVDRLPTSAGSALPPEAFELPEASVVRRLREAGALILGKTATAEFAASGPAATTNPHHPAHTPGGSSSGSAAAVAAGYLPLALGSQTAGSVVRPAAFCGIAGFKPSYGRIPTDGVLGHAPSVDTLGCFAQDLDGIGLVASVIVDGWRTDLAEVDRPHPVLGVPAGPYLEGADAEALDAFDATVERLCSAGIEVRRTPFLDDADAVVRRHEHLMAAEYGDVHASLFERWGALYTGPSAATFDESRRVTVAERRAGLAGRLELRARVGALLDREGLDALICPSAPGPAPRGLGSTGDPVMNTPWTHAGVPTLSVPAGTVGGLPVGLQVVGAFGRDEALLATARALPPLAAAW